MRTSKPSPDALDPSRATERGPDGFHPCPGRSVPPMFGRLVRRLVLAAALCPLVGSGAASAGDGSAGSPPRPGGPRAGKPAGSAPGRGGKGGGYSIEQAVSDRAQLHTIAFDGLAFLTGSFGADTFFPPGKVCDYFGFQYLRDVDLGGLGHNSKFLPRIADNLLAVLDAGARNRLVALAREQAPTIEELARRRFVPIRAFRRLLEGDAPKDRPAFDRAVVAAYFADLYALDGELAWRRARTTGEILRGLTAAQREALGRLVFGDSRTWPEVPEVVDRRRMTHREHVAVMTYASEMFSWWAGNLDADVYFCPERHGTYFGGFYMKDAPALRNPGTNISTELTGDAGAAFLATLTDAQRPVVERLVETQRATLADVVTTRRSICTELRRFLREDADNHDRVVALARAYGALDGELSSRYATAFAEVARTLTDAQRRELVRLRNLEGDVVTGAYLYSDPIATPDVPATDAWFGRAPARGASK